MSDSATSAVHIVIDHEGDQLHLRGEVQVPFDLYSRVVKEVSSGTLRDDIQVMVYDEVKESASGTGAPDGDDVARAASLALECAIRRTSLVTHSIGNNVVRIGKRAYASSMDMSKLFALASSQFLDAGRHLGVLSNGGEGGRIELSHIPGVVELRRDIWEEPFQGLSSESRSILAEESWSRINENCVAFIMRASESGLGASAQVHMRENINRAIRNELGRFSEDDWLSPAIRPSDSRR